MTTAPAKQDMPIWQWICFWFPELWLIFASKITATKFNKAECSYTVIISTIPTMTAIFVCFVVSLVIVNDATSLMTLEPIALAL